MKIKLLVQILLSSFILSTLAAVPSEINYQGLITNSDGDPIESATNSVAVNLYQVETGGTSVYTQSFTQVASDANGIYSIQIGGASLQSVLEANNELWLELIINEETLSPRQEINSVPYALVAKSAESIVPGSDADAAITSLQASDASRPSQAPVLLAIGWNYPSLSSVYVGYHDDVLGQPAVAEVGDRILITEQSNASENGIYEVESLNGNFASLVRAEDYNSAEEINAGDFVFVQKGDNAGQGYLVGTVSESFELGVDNLNFSRFTIDTTLPVVFDSRIEAQELRVVGPGGSVYFNGTINSISSLYVDEMLVPTPVYGSEATNKSYVDAVVAANTSVIATETSTRATAITALQADVDQNESDADAAIAAEASTARAAEQANADNIFSNTTDISNNAVNISNNSTDIATNSTNIITNTGSVTTNTTNITLNATAITAEVTRAEAAEAALQADIDQNESDADAAITAEATTARTAEQAIATAISVEATRAEAAEAALQADVDQNESDANAAIASLQASDASQAPVLLAIEWSPMSLSYVMVGYHDTALGQPAVAAAGDRILMVGQASASENGIYEVDGLDGNFASLVRADDYNSAEEINAGDFVFVQKGDNAGQGYILEALPENFELGADNLNFSRFTINTTRPVVFDSRIEAQELRVLGPGGSVNFDGSNNYINGNLSVDGYRADFEDVDEMLVPTPDQDNEATNKAYVDAAVATNTSAIATETSARATAITALQADVDQNESDADAAIATEASTARAAEQANADDIFSNTTDISNNAVNISNHSTDIANNTANISTNTGNVTTNTTNITSNAAAITSEVARAEAVESALATAITAEASRAEAAEAALQADIDQNESDADAAIAALQAVDASSARQFVVDFGFMDNKSNLNSVYINLELTDYSGYYSCEVGDTVLLTGQADSSENGIYEITNASGQIWSKTISLTRSSSYDTAEELNEGDLVLIEKGESNGLAFMLGAVPEAFVLGNDALTWYRCGINTNQDIEFTGVVTVGELRTYPQHSWETELRLGQSSNYFDVNSGTFEFRGNNGSRVDFRDYIEVNFQNYGGVDFDTDVEFTSTVTVPTPTEDNEVANKAYVDTAVATNTTALDAETSARATAITALQTDVDQNEAGADAAIAAEASTSRAAEQANASAIQTNATAISDEASTARAAEQANADAIFSNTTDISNNTTDIVNNASAIAAEATTARAAEQANATAITTLQSDVNQNESDADTAIADIKTGDTVFSGSPSFTGVKALPSGQTDYTSNYYELQPWNTPSSVVPNYATVNVDGLLNADVINAERMLRVGNLYITENEFISDYGQVNISNLRTFDLEIDGDIMFDGYRADFAMASEVRVPTPDQDFEAANKAYVDAVVVPSGGLIAWPSANDMPDGWSNAMLSSPMNNYIWIRKD